MKNQYTILREIQKHGYNVCTCGNCGDVILVDWSDDDVISDIIPCPHCGKEQDYEDCPDLYHEEYKPTIIKL